MLIRHFKRSLVLGCLLILSACGNDISQTTDALNIIADTLPEAFLGEEYAANILVRGGQTPFRYELSGGELPPGLSLQSGTVQGTPTTEGSFEFTVTVSDARLATTFRDYVITVGEPPPAGFTLNVPDTDVQNRVTLRAQLTGARRLEAFRTVLEWDATRFELVPNSLRNLNDAFLIFSNSDEGFLQLDVAILGGELSGDRRVFEFELQAVEPGPLFIEKRTEFASALTGHAFLQDSEGRPAETFTPDVNPDFDETNPDLDDPALPGPNPEEVPGDDGQPAEPEDEPGDGTNDGGDQ